jgi:hypothetical protein
MAFPLLFTPTIRVFSEKKPEKVELTNRGWSWTGWRDQGSFGTNSVPSPISASQLSPETIR